MPGSSKTLLETLGGVEWHWKASARTNLREGYIDKNAFLSDVSFGRFSILREGYIDKDAFLSDVLFGWFSNLREV